MPDQIQIFSEPSTEDLTKTSNPLLRIKAVFPFDLFPNVIIIDRYKIDIRQNDLLSEQITTFPLTSTLTVSTIKNIFFSSIEIHDPATGNRLPVRYFWPNDAEKFRRLAEGLVIGMRQGVNFITMDTNEVLRCAMGLGAIEKR